MASRFDSDTAVMSLGDGSYAARVDPAWSVVRGPNGGYLAAIILRALAAAVGDPERAPRSFTVHYASPPREGQEITITATVERTGRSLTSCSGRVHQDGRLVALAMGAFSSPRPGPEFCDLVVPTVADPAELPDLPVHEGAPPIAHRWDTRWAIGQPPFLDAPPAAEAVGGGWIRLEDPHLLDAPMVTAITDAWVPPVFSRTSEPIVVPTIDLTVHFRSSLPRPDARPDDFALAVFRTHAASEGFIEEDGEVWSAGGALLAQSRQLAAVLPYS